DLEAGLGQEVAPFVLGVVAHVGRVAELLGLLVTLARVERVLDHDEPVAHALELSDRGADVLEVVRRDPRRDDVESAVVERDVLGRRQHVGLHPGRRVQRDHLGAELTETPRDVAAAGGDVERLDALGRLAPLDQQVEVGAGAVRLALAVRLGALRPGAHAASSTARRAASSIVASTYRFGGAASARILRPSSAFVPSRRTTMGWSNVSCSSACRIPRATTSPRVIPPKMLNRIDLTCGSA